MNDQIGRARVSLRVSWFTLLVATVAYACGGGGSDAPTQPQSGGRGIRVVAGGGQSDTIFAVLPQALVVEIRDSTGALATGHTVRFSPLIHFGGSGPGVLVSPLEQRNFDTFASDVTDAQGRAKILVQMWYAAGAAQLEVAVPELGVADTLTYTVKPGAPAGFTISPRDTSVVPGGSYTLKVATKDRFENPIAAAVPTFSATGVSVSSTGQVTATSATVRARIVVSYQALSDSASVSVVPRLPMVITQSGGVVLINSDGTGATTLAATSDGSLSPSSVAATPTVVFYRGDAWYSGKLWVVQPNGAPRLLLPLETRNEAWPRLSPDGAWVYFVRDIRSLWRVHLDGTGLDSLTDFTPPRVYSAPTISPDGRSVALEHGGTDVKIVDVATKASRTLPISCAFPSYSPDGAFFACVSLTNISVVKTDGTGQRVVISFAVFGGPDELSGVDWTPDGKWILAMLGGRPTLIEVSSGAVLPLTGVGGFQPSFVK
jgi:hypothetical protein